MVAGPESVPAYKERLEKLKAEARDAASTYSFVPTDDNLAKLERAKDLYRKFQQGLKIVKNQLPKEKNIVVSRAHGQFRNNVNVSKSPGFLDDLFQIIDDSSTCIAVKAEEIAKAENKQDRLNNGMKSISGKVQESSAFESLQDLADGNIENTQCIICIEPLGTTTSEDGGPDILLTKCSHLFCKKCLYDYSLTTRQSQCPT